MNATPPLPWNQRSGCSAYIALAVPVAGSVSSLRLPGLMVLAAVTTIACLAGALAVRPAWRAAFDTGWQAARLGARAG